MRKTGFRNLFTFPFAVISSFLLIGCGSQPATTNLNVATSNSNANLANANVNRSSANTANANMAVASAVTESAEPTEYQATVTVRLETIGEQQKMTMPTLTANVARSGNDRRMQFTMPAGGRVVYLDRAGTNYLVLPEKKQYAELNRDSLGFDVRRMLMPEQIIQHVKNVQGVERVGEEKYNGRDVIKYKYAAVANTQSRVGQVATESFLLVDKATGLPLRSETVSQSQTGGNVQGFSGLRVVTEITEVKTETSPELFAEPTEFQKIESDQVRSLVDLIFNSIAGFLAQMMKQAQTAPNPAGSPSQ